jgi:hypothetical protein
MAYTTIDDPSEHFNTLIWSGNNASSRSFTGLGFSPDWTWIKSRSDGAGHGLFDSVRGANKQLNSGGTDAEITNHQFGYLSSFDSDGFTLTEGTYSSYESGDTNMTGRTYVGWNWRGSDSNAVSNSDGSITSTVSANTTAGFSIVTYTSAAGGQTIGHGLGVKPDMYIIKERTTSGDDWFVYHSALGEGKKLRLSGTSAAESDTNIWQNTAPTTTVAYLQNDGGGVNQNTGGNQNYVGYFFNNVKGYSKMGSYTGNGNADGPFIYTGFRPAWLMIRRTDSANTWYIWDNKRNTFNVCNKELRANTGDAETTTDKLDFLSNGFKIRATFSSLNASGGTYIYMAFAEHPFVSSEGVPVTAG